MMTLKPIEDNRAQNILKGPLCGSIVARSSLEGPGPHISPTCMLCPLDEDVMGLNIKIDKIGTSN